ncbi:MAG: histidine kinase dimerization/phospho-acceptor domain-containing protein, partial [Myxococcota bacterium]
MRFGMTLGDRGDTVVCGASWKSLRGTEGLDAQPEESWSLADWACLFSKGMIFLILLPVGLLFAASARQDLVPFLDSQALEWLLRACLLSLTCWLLILLGATRARRVNPEAAWLAHMPIQLYAVSNAFNAYMLGIFTNPFTVFALAGGLPVAMLAYGTRRAWLGAMCFIGLIGAATVATQLGAIPYEPLMASSPLVGGRLSVVWIRGFGLVVAVGCGVLMLVSYRIVAEVRAREARLRLKHAQLFRVHEDLVQARSDLELSRDALERRVRLRTRELRETNERLRAEAAKRSELSADLEALRLVMEDAVEGIAWIGGDGLVEGVNGAYAKLHRVSTESMQGTHWKEWTHCDDRDLVARATARLGAEPRQELEFRGLCGDGSSFCGAVVLVGDSRDGGGRHFRFLRDVSRNRELAEQLTQASKMDAIGRLAGGVAHDFNNQLAAILASADQLAERPEFANGNEDVRELLEWIQASAQRGACLTRQLLDFARPQSEGREVIDVNDSLRAVVAILGPVLGTSIRVRAELGSARLSVLGSASRLDASLM